MQHRNHIFTAEPVSNNSSVHHPTIHTVAIHCLGGWGGGECFSRQHKAQGRISPTQHGGYATANKLHQLQDIHFLLQSFHSRASWLSIHPCILLFRDFSAVGFRLEFRASVCTAAARGQSEKSGRMIGAE